MSIDDEVTRLRRWRHETDKTLWAINVKLDSLVREMATLGPEVQKLANDDRIEKEVRKQVRAKDTLRLTWAQRVGASVIAVLTAADLVSRHLH